ncbi:MAG TPA: tetratricopeptide repeat protein [Abditibacterium sp.]|jgi:tetratricopeptide (TPR) repeat protein
MNLALMSNPNERAITPRNSPSEAPREGDETRAERALSASQKSELHVASGDMRGDDGDFAGALEDYKKAANLDPTSPRRLVKLAEGYAANDLHGKAFDLYRRALESTNEQGGEELTDAYIGLGDLCCTFARSAAAVRSYERAVRSRPKQPFLRWKLAVALATMGLYEQAEAQLLQILELAPRDAFYHFHLADLYRVMGRDAESVSEMERAVELAPRDEYYRLRLGAALLRNGDNATAIPQFERAAQLAPTNASYQTLLLFAYICNDQAPEIAVDIDKIELGAYDADFVSRIQRLAQAV